VTDGTAYEQLAERRWRTPDLRTFLSALDV
jgi:putative hydrolase of the HAD superfamily